MYRRATTNSYSPRVSSFIESMGKDDTINNLKKEYSQNRSIQSEYDTLTSQIAKIQRQNERIQQQHIKTEADYKQKIQMSQNFMQELRLQINELEENIKQGPNPELKESKKKQTVQEILKMDAKMAEIQTQNKILEESTNQQQVMIVKLMQTVKEFCLQKQNIKIKTTDDKQMLKQEQSNYSILSNQMKNTQQNVQKLQQQLIFLNGKKVQVQAKVKVFVERIKELKEKLESWENKTREIHIKCQQLEQENLKITEEAISLKQKICISLSKNQDHTKKLHSLETAFKETINGLQAKRTSKQKLALNYYEVHNEIDKIEESLKKFSFMIEDQQNSNKELINNLKKSIKNDQEAVKALSRKAAILALVSKS